MILDFHGTRQARTKLVADSLWGYVFGRLEMTALTFFGIFGDRVFGMENL